MDEIHKRTPRAQAPSLILLESALIAAKALTPPRANRPVLDPNEALAIHLIECIKRPRHVSLPGFTGEPPQPLTRARNFEMAGNDA